MPITVDPLLRLKQNSVRHNLSMNDSFVNLDRLAGEKGTGKGGFWKVADRVRSSFVGWMTIP